MLTTTQPSADPYGDDDDLDQALAAVRAAKAALDHAQALLHEQLRRDHAAGAGANELARRTDGAPVPPPRPARSSRPSHREYSADGP
ncbi:hypothetical protein ACU686_26265 [Yinghuangia aomiensis]